MVAKVSDLSPTAISIPTKQSVGKNGTKTTINLYLKRKNFSFPRERFLFFTFLMGIRLYLSKY